MQSDCVVREALMEDLARLRTLCGMGKLSRCFGKGEVWGVGIGRGMAPRRIGRSVEGKWAMMGWWSE